VLEGVSQVVFEAEENPFKEDQWSKKMKYSVTKVNVLKLNIKKSHD